MLHTRLAGSALAGLGVFRPEKLADYKSNYKFLVACQHPLGAEATRLGAPVRSRSWRIIRIIIRLGRRV